MGLSACPDEVPQRSRPSPHTTDIGLPTVRHHGAAPVNQVIIENPVINSPFESPAGTSASPTRASPTRSSPAGASAPTSSPSPAKEGCPTARLHGVDGGPASAQRLYQPRAPAGSPVALRRLPGHHPRHPHPPRLLAAAGPRAPALLLPDRGAGDAHLHHRSRRQVRRRLDREYDAPGERARQPPASTASP